MVSVIISSRFKVNIVILVVLLEISAYLYVVDAVGLNMLRETILPVYKQHFIEVHTVPNCAKYFISY